MERNGLGMRGLVVAGIALAVTGAPGAEVSAAEEPPPDDVAVSVVGTSTLVGQLEPGTTSFEGGVLRTRGSILITIEESSDPRASGRATIRLDIDAYPGPGGMAGAAAAQVRYGEMRLENADGAWQGWFTGRLNGSRFIQTYWLAGESAYEGLSYVVTAGGNGNVWLSDGLIYPGVLPPVGSINRLPVDGPGRDLPTALPMTLGGKVRAADAP